MVTYKQITGICVALMLLTGLAGAQDNYAIYVSKQQNKSSVFSGSRSKTTDKHESGNVSLTKEGPIDHELDPNDMNIGPNQSRTWNGKVRASIPQAPEPGTSAPASIKADYTVKYSRPAGTGSGGAVIETYNCNRGINDGCAYHGPGGGRHEVVEKTGDYTINFTVYSILVSLPDTICLSATSGSPIVSGNPSPTSYPASGGAFKWTALSANLTIDDPNVRSPRFSLPDQTAIGSAKIEFTYEGLIYEATAAVKYCDCNCQPLVNQTLAFGPYSISYSANPESNSPDGQGQCRYSSSNAGFTLNMNGQIQRSAPVTDATLSFKRNCRDQAVTEASIRWEGEVDIAEIKYFSAKVQRIDLSLNAAGNMSGRVQLNAYMNQDKTVYSDNFLLKRGVNGTFAFNFSGGQDASGSFDFLGVRAFDLEIKKGGNAIAEFRDGSLSSDGTLDATFATSANPNYRTNAFKVQLDELALHFSINLTDGFQIIDGSGKATLSEMRGTDGTLSLGLSYNQDNCHAELSGESLKAFTMELESFSVAADFNMSFDLTKIEGSLSAKHPDFNTAIDITSFVVENGRLTTFQGAGNVEYKRFKFILENAAYDGTKLSITAKSELNVTIAMALDVSEFTVANDGAIGIGGIGGRLEKTPMKVEFSATFSANEFRGTFTADLAKIGLDGSIILGATDTYNYGDLAITAHVNIPIPNTGLKLTQIGGTAGFNYPNQGDYKVGLRLAVADMADLCEVMGAPTIILGTSSLTMILDGTVKVLRNQPFVQGDLHASFVMPASTLNGTVGTTIKIPNSGYIFSSNNLTVSFGVGNGRYSLSGSNMGGSMFNNLINFTNGAISMGGTCSPLTFSGSLAGRASGAFTMGFSQPTWVGTFGGDLNINMNSDVNAALNSAGLSGSFAVDVSGSGTASYSNSWGSQSLTISGNSTCQIGTQNGGYYLYGNMTVNLPFQICVPNPFTWELDCLGSLDIPVSVSL